MAYRTFVDSTNAEWHVWDIVPRLNERRTAATTERRDETKVIPFPNRRRDNPRRIVDSLRAMLSGTYAQGWLCFERDMEKRRLSPIPADWTSCSEELLEVYERRAERVSGAYKSFMLPDGERLADAG